ncbi:MAG: lasso peptide biosynthesis protein [Pseudomonadales bacterium]|nr:lasso peptide biosynthesis protein [Pseudomonadales bacterium]
MTDLTSALKVCNRVFPDSKETYKLKKYYFGLLNFIHQNDWTGACHASSSILYVLLQEEDIDAKIYIGEAVRGSIVFDHSWVEVGGEPLDAAISNTLIEGIRFPPVFLGYDLDSGERTQTNYSFIGGSGLEAEMAFYASHTLGTYMDNFPGHPEGVWGVARDVAKSIGQKLNLNRARRRYADTTWDQKS